MASPDAKLAAALTRAELEIKRIRGLKTYRSVAWEELATALRDAATAVEEVARAAGVWV